MDNSGLQVLEHCLVGSEHALAGWAPQTWSIPLLDCWLRAVHDALAWELSRDKTASAAQEHGYTLVAWLERMADQLKARRASPAVITKLRTAAKQITKMIDLPSHCQAVARAKNKPLHQLMQNLQQSAAEKQPVLSHAGPGATGTNLSSSNGTRSSPFLTDIEEQLSRSSAWENQLAAFTAVKSHFDGCNSERPAQQQLQQVTSATLDAFGKLRAGVYDTIMNLRLSSSNGEYPGTAYNAKKQLLGMQQQVDQWLKGFADAWSNEQELLGEDSGWRNLAAGVVEPTGTGKTGIMHLMPFAVLGSDGALTDMPAKVLLITPNLAIRGGVFDSFTEAGKVSLRDVMCVTSNPKLLPTAFDLSTLPGMKVTAAPAAGEAAGTGSRSNRAVKAGGFGHQPGAASMATNNNAAAVAAAAAIGLDDDEEEYAFVETADMEFELMKNNAALLSNNAHDQSAPGSSMYSSRAASGSKQHQLSPILQKLSKSDVVVANIHQLPFKKLEALFPRDYFGVVLVDEAHHAVARTWATVLDYFAPASKVCLTATPFRGDRAPIPMAVVTGAASDLKIKERARQGLCSNVAYAPVPVNAVTILEEGAHSRTTYSKPHDIMRLGERRDIQTAAMKSPEVRQSVMRHSLKLMEHLRSLSGQTHTVIAQAVNKDDAEALAEEWQVLVNNEYGARYKVGYTHCGLPADKQAEVKAAAKSGGLDVVIHVGQLGEGFDAPALSVVAVFKVFRSMLPFTQLLGRAARRMKGVPAVHPANVAYLVAHPLLGYHKHWQIYCEERQDTPRELSGIGRVSNVEVVNCNISLNGNAWARHVQYLVDPEEIDPDGPQLGGAAAAAANTQAVAGVAAAAPGPAAAAAAAPPAAAAAAPDHHYPRNAALQDLQQLNGASLKQLREIIKRHPCLSNVTTSGHGRTKEAVAADIRERLQAVTGVGGLSPSNGVLQLQLLAELRGQAAAAGTTLKDLREIKQQLAPYLNAVATSGAGRTTDVVRRDIIAQLTSLMTMQAVV